MKISTFLFWVFQNQGKDHEGDALGWIPGGSWTLRFWKSITMIWERLLGFRESFGRVLEKVLRFVRSIELHFCSGPPCCFTEPRGA